jgi:glycosyltransferase family protein
MNAKTFATKLILKVRNLPKRTYRSFESIQYRNYKYVSCLKIMTDKESVDYLAENVVSFCRFGDGEIALMKGESIAFQKYDPLLAQRLKEILKADKKGLVIGINYFYLNPVNGVNQYTQNFLDTLVMQRKFLIKNCNKDTTYIDAAITQVYQNYETLDFEHHFEKMQQMFRNKDITVICGATVMDNIKYNALDVCNSVEYIYGPSKDAFNEYSKIYEMAIKVDNNRIICVILGPTAKVLVYDLHCSGRIAWDIGHYIKDYDAYMKKQPRNAESIERFFKPD